MLGILEADVMKKTLLFGMISLILLTLVFVGCKDISKTGKPIWPPMGEESGGCTDPLANNYDSTAMTDDGSCTYSIGDMTGSESVIEGEGVGEEVIADTNEKLCGNEIYADDEVCCEEEDKHYIFDNSDGKTKCCGARKLRPTEFEGQDVYDVCCYDHPNPHIPTYVIDSAANCCKGVGVIPEFSICCTDKANIDSEDFGPIVSKGYVCDIGQECDKGNCKDPS